MWAYAALHGLTVVTQDRDYELLVANQTPPKVVRTGVGNMKRLPLWILLERVWPAVISAIERPEVRLVRLYRTHLEMS